MARNIFISYSEYYDGGKKDFLESLIGDSKILGQPIVVVKHDDDMNLLTEKIINELNKADYIIPILTAKSLKTQWVNQEIGYAKCKEKDGLIKIRPLLDQSLLEGNKLNGFIHNKLDLPNHFDDSDEQKKFEIIASKLVEKIESEYKKRKKLIKFSGDSKRFIKNGNLLYQFPDKQTRELFGYLEDDLYEVDKQESSNFRKIGVISSIKRAQLFKFEDRYFALFNNELKLIPDNSTLQYITGWNKNPIKEIEKLPEDFKFGNSLISYDKIKTNK